MDKEPTLINQLFTQNNQLNAIIKKAAELKTLNLIFQTILNSELSKHCYISELTENTLTIIVDNASWATVLRYAIPDIIKTLKNHQQFEKLQDINYKVAKN